MMRFSGQAQSEPIHHTSKKFRVRSFTIHFPSPISKSFTSHNMRIATCASGRWTISRTLSFQVVNNKNTGTAAGLGLSRGSRRPCLPLRTWVSAAGSREAASAPSFGFKTRRGSRLVSSQAAPGPNSDVTQSAGETGAKFVWLKTTTKEVMTAAMEAGLCSTFLFEGQEGEALSAEWAELARFSPVLRDDLGHLKDGAGEVLGTVVTISGPEDLKDAEKESSGKEGYVMVEFEGVSWQVIPAENLIAAFHSSKAQLVARANSASSAELMLDALEIGVQGVVLDTEDPSEVRALAAHMKERELEGSRLKLEAAVVTLVEPVGMGDRVCVDTCSLMVPGEGMLVGNFARALFLVHSECAESSYIASRPFRVNAGPVHAYAQGVSGRTAYLSELKSGSQVTIVDADGRCRTTIVGRTKIETRPLVLVEAKTSDGELHSAILQNAETVRLIGPDGESPLSQGWSTISVSELAAGHKVYIHRQGAARHTGISIDERIVEK